MLASGDPEFLDEMRLAPRGDGRFGGRLTNRFNAPVQPQGGITTALAVHAAELALERDDQMIRSLTTVFAGQVPAGEVDVEVEVLRQGRGASQVSVTVRPVDGDPAGHCVLATFVSERESDIRYDGAHAPDVPPPDECVDRWTVEGPDHPEHAGPRPTFFTHFDNRVITGHMPWDPPWEPTGEVLSWMRWHDTPRDAGGQVSPLAIIPPCDTMPGAVFDQHGKDDRWFLVPSVDFTLQLFDTRLGDGDWMLRRNTSRWAGHGLAAADLEVYSADGRPIAFATQLMHVRLADRDAVARRVLEAHASSADAPEGQRAPS